MDKRHTITIIAIIIAIIGIIVFTLVDLEKVEGQGLEPIELTADETSFKEEILKDEKYVPSINEWGNINEKKSIMAETLQKMQNEAQAIATGTYNQQIIKLNDLIK
jgi:hypothetical protein